MFGSPQQQITPPGGLNYASIGGANVPFQLPGETSGMRGLDLGGMPGTQANEQALGIFPGMRNIVQNEPWSLPGEPKVLDWQDTIGQWQGGKQGVDPLAFLRAGGQLKDLGQVDYSRGAGDIYRWD